MRYLRYAMILILTVGGTTASAQDLPTTETTHLDLSPYLHPGTQIRISGSALNRVGGFVVGVQTDAILLGDARGASANGARPIPLATVDTLWTRGRWMWEGVALGSSVGLLIGGATCVFSQNERCIAFPVGIVAGTATGALVGYLRRIWRPRYVRRDGGPVPTLGPWMQR
jgi:hypothetical protein